MEAQRHAASVFAMPCWRSISRRCCSSSQRRFCPPLRNERTRGSLHPLPRPVTTPQRLSNRAICRSGMIRANWPIRATRSTPSGPKADVRLSFPSKLLCTPGWLVRQALMAEMIADRPRQPLNSLTSRLNFSGFSMNMKCAPPSFSSKISVFAPLICFPIQT